MYIRAMTLGVIMSLSCIATQAPAQEKSFKEAIIGSWLITALYDEYQNGERKENWGGPVKGQITFDSNGRFTTIIIGPSVSSMKANDPRQPDALVLARYGTYTVDEARKKITGQIEAATYSPRIGTETSWTVQGSGDKLTFIGSPRKDQHGILIPRVEVRRP